MFWLAPDSVPTLGDWFRAGGYRTFYKGKWHVSHPYLDAEDGDGYLLSIDDDGTPIEDNIQKYLDADLLDDHGFSEWVGPDPHGLGKHNTGVLKDPFTADETIALLKRLDADDGRRAVADGVLVPEPARRLAVRRHRAHAGAALPPLTGAACRSGPDARGGPLDEALLPAELRRQLEHDHRAAAVERDPPEVLLPDAGRGRPADHACPRRPARHRGLREHDRDLHLRSRRHAGRPRRDAREVARRLRGSAARAVHRLQPAAARRRPRARHPDQPRRPHPHAARPHRHRPRPGARPLAVRPQRRPSARRTRPLVGDPRRRTGRAHGADPLHHRRRDQRGQRDDAQPVRTRRQAPAPLLDRQAAQPPADRDRRGRRRRRAAPRQVLPLLRQRPVLDRPRGA